MPLPRSTVPVFCTVIKNLGARYMPLAALETLGSASAHTITSASRIRFIEDLLEFPVPDRNLIKIAQEGKKCQACANILPLVSCILRSFCPCFGKILSFCTRHCTKETMYLAGHIFFLSCFFPQHEDVDMGFCRKTGILFRNARTRAPPCCTWKPCPSLGNEKTASSYLVPKMRSPASPRPGMM